MTVDAHAYAATAALEKLRGKRITVMGLGRFGGAVGLIRFLARHGIAVTVTDTASPQDLTASLHAIAGMPGVTTRLGEHRDEDFTECDVLFVNPAVQPANRFLGLARAAGARLGTEIGLFLALCPARVIAVTGTSGKSTTCALAAAMLQEAGQSAVFGGNVGGSLLGMLESLTASSTVVLELSSFQLHYLSQDWLTPPRPQTVSILNIFNDHLNWHGTFAAYAASKRFLLSPPAGTETNWAVVPGDDGRILPWARQSGRRVLALGSDPRGCHAAVHGTAVVRMRADETEIELFRREDAALPGAMNMSNARCAAGLAFSAGAPPEAIRRALGSFRGLPHRMEPIATIGGITFVNSSVATTPVEAARTLEAVAGPTVLITGGGEGKDLPFYPLAHAAARLCRCAVTFGEAAARIAGDFAHEAPALPCLTAGTLQEAVHIASREARRGDTVLLAPGCPSFDSFLNFSSRGDAFRQCVRSIAGAAASLIARAR